MGIAHGGNSICVKVGNELIDPFSTNDKLRILDGCWPVNKVVDYGNTGCGVSSSRNCIGFCIPDRVTKSNRILNKSEVFQRILWYILKWRDGEPTSLGPNFDK